MTLLKRLFREEDGAGMVEYALLVALIALVVALAIPTVTDAIVDLFGDIAAQLSGGETTP